MQTIAFIGCGAMGAPIAERLIDGGYTVRVFDPRAEAVAPLVAASRGDVAATPPRCTSGCIASARGSNSRTV